MAYPIDQQRHILSVQLIAIHICVLPNGWQLITYTLLTGPQYQCTCISEMYTAKFAFVY